VSEKGSICCYEFRGFVSVPEKDHTARPDDCQGILTTASAKGYPEDGYYIEVCPRLSWLGAKQYSIDFCGNGADVIVMHQDTIPTSEDYDAAARIADEGDW
jgi:hypothetical protein